MKKILLNVKDRIMNSHPIIKGLAILLLAPNGFLIGLSILVGKLIASGQIPPMAVMGKFVAKMGVSFVFFGLIKQVLKKLQFDVSPVEEELIADLESDGVHIVENMNQSKFQRYVKGGIALCFDMCLFVLSFLASDKAFIQAMRLIH